MSINIKVSLKFVIIITQLPSPQLEIMASLYPMIYYDSEV